MIVELKSFNQTSGESLGDSCEYFHLLGLGDFPIVFPLILIQPRTKLAEHEKIWPIRFFRSAYCKLLHQDNGEDLIEFVPYAWYRCL